MSIHPKPSEPHQFVISDEDLFFGAEPTTKDVRTVSCYICGDQPGQGMHKPPPPPLHALVIDETAKRLSEIMSISWDALRPEAARVSFTVIQQVRQALKEMSKAPAYTDPFEGCGYVFDAIDAELDGLLTQLRKIGWDQ